MQHENYPRASLSRRVSATALALLIGLQAGCARHATKPAPDASAETQAAPAETPPPMPPTEFQSSLGRVAVVAVAELPDELLGSYAPAAEDARSAGLGSLGCGSGPECAGVLLAELTIALIMKATEPKNIETIPASAVPGAPAKPESAGALEAKIIQDALRDQIVAAARASGVKVSALPPESAGAKRSARDYTALAAKVDTVLEVELTQVLVPFHPGPFTGVRNRNDPWLPLEMKAHVRLVKTRDNSLIHYADYTYTGKNLRYSDWAGHNGERLVQALEHGYEALGHDISDSLFLLYPYAERSDNGEQTCGLAPLAPAEEATASSRAPRLEWQSFPRAADKLAAPKDIARIKNVKYDLIVGTGGNNESFDVLYRREGLPKPSHRLEMPLQPDTRYFWSVRARFTLDGRQRVTEWGTRCPFEPQLTVSWQLYRFYTPGE